MSRYKISEYILDEASYKTYFELWLDASSDRYIIKERFETTKEWSEYHISDEVLDALLNSKNEVK